MENEKKHIFFWPVGKSWKHVYAEYVVGGGAGIILVEGNGDTVHITQGHYDLTRAFFIGLDPVSDDQGISNVTVDDGATINGTDQIVIRSRNISWYFTSAMGPSGLGLYVEIENGTIARLNDFTAADGISRAFIRVFGGAVFTYADYSDTPGTPFFNLAAGVNCNFHIQNPSTFAPLLGANFIGGGAGSAVSMVYEDPSTHDGFLKNPSAPFTTPTINHLIPPGDFNALSVGAPIASAATIQPVFPIHVVTGSTNIDTISLPYPNFTGFLRLLSPSGATWQLTNAGNIARAVIPVSGSSIDLTWEPIGALWYPAQ